ncbi:MAG TPA: B-box zinc finger protein [Actinomycetota bacterium]|jgi:hypothetical protein|nr:B-box zinc finger protein [Actinomycetota bacterium]
MPPDERSVKSAERCHAHPGAAAVASCEECGRPVCLTCAVPVRGTVVGLECLPPDVRTGGTPEPPHRSAAFTTAGAALGVALIATVLPWARQGGWFGAWTWPFRSEFPWSMLTAPAALLACVVWWFGRRRDPAHRTAVAVAVLAAIVALGAYLAVDRPPDFTRPWVGPYLAGAAGGVSLAAAIVSLVAPRRSRAMS